MELPYIRPYWIVRIILTELVHYIAPSLFHIELRLWYQGGAAVMQKKTFHPKILMTSFTWGEMSRILKILYKCMPNISRQDFDDVIFLGWNDTNYVNIIQKDV